MNVALEWRRVSDEIAVMNVSGRSSIMDGNILQQATRGLLEDGIRYIVLNLTGLSHMDSFGLGQLIATYLSVRDRGGDVRLVGPTPAIRDLLRNTRLDTVLKIFDTDDEAIQSIRPL